jgi:hypothetical protein
LRGKFASRSFRTFAVLTPVFALVVASLLAPVGAAAGSPSVIWDTQASTDRFGATTPPPNDGSQTSVQPNTEVEPSIAVNPGDPNDVVTVFQEGRVDAGGDADNGFATTLNAQSTTPAWMWGNLPAATKAVPNPATVECATSPNAPQPLDRASDAVVTFGLAAPGQPNYHGYIAYANSLVFDDNSCSGLPSGMAINQSTDGGKTWSNALILQADNFAGLNDKNWIVADNRPGAAHPGRVYVFWDKVVGGLAYAYCDPAGTLLNGVGCNKANNWTSFNLVVVHHPGTNATTLPAIGVIPVVLKDGSVGLAFDDEVGTQTCTGTNPTDNACLNPSGTDIAWTIIPQADTVAWPLPLPVANDWIDITPYDSNGVPKQRAGSLPQAAVDPNTNEVYITWESKHFRSDGLNDAVVVYATDPGTGLPGLAPGSWTGPIKVNPGSGSDSIDHYNPTIAIGSDSILRVAYRQRSEPSNADLSGPGYPIDSYYQEAPTGTTTSSSFSSPLKIDTAKNTDNPQFGAFSRGGLFEGDYEQIAAGGADQSFFTRDEAWPGSSSTCTTNFSTPQTCQNQQTWVVFISPQLSNAAPEVRFVPALVLIAGAVGIGAVLRRRRGRNTATSSTT